MGLATQAEGRTHVQRFRAMVRALGTRRASQTATSLYDTSCLHHVVSRRAGIFRSNRARDSDTGHMAALIIYDTQP